MKKLLTVSVLVIVISLVILASVQMYPVNQTDTDLAFGLARIEIQDQIGDHLGKSISRTFIRKKDFKTDISSFVRASEWTFRGHATALYEKSSGSGDAKYTRTLSVRYEVVCRVSQAFWGKQTVMGCMINETDTRTLGR